MGRSTILGVGAAFVGRAVGGGLGGSSVGRSTGLAMGAAFVGRAAGRGLEGTLVGRTVGVLGASGSGMGLVVGGGGRIRVGKPVGLDSGPTVGLTSAG